MSKIERTGAMMRVSVTDLEAYRRVVNTEYGREDQLIAKLRGEPTEATWQMQAGSAWDRAISFGQPRDLTATDYFFADDAISKASAHVGHGLWQVKQQLELPTKHGSVMLVAVADHICGLVVQENKACFSAPSAKNYEASLQWRFYLWLFAAEQFQYNLFDFRDPKEGYCELLGIISFRMWPYEGMVGECTDWLNRFLDWADSRRLLTCLERKSSTPVAA